VSLRSQSWPLELATPDDEDVFSGQLAAMPRAKGFSGKHRLVWCSAARSGMLETKPDVRSEVSHPAGSTGRNGTLMITGGATWAMDVLCVGHASYDLTLLVDHHPGRDEKCFATDMSVCGGGPAANAAVTVARLGGVSALAGYLGEDLYGCRHLDELKAEGVHTEFIARGGHPTPLSVILVKPDGARTVVNHKASTPFLESVTLDLSVCRPRVMLLDGHEPKISPALAQAARSAGIPTVLDAGSVHEGTLELAPLVDYLVASEKFARRFTSREEPRQALAALAELAPCAVITLGEKGLIWRKGDASGEVPAFSVPALDTTGAGDVFHGALALGIARSMQFQALLRYASAAAALACMKVGARTGIPRGDELDDFLSAAGYCPE
jgi:sulfofructose kinase